MKQENLREILMIEAKQLEHIEKSSNVFGFPSKLRELRKDVNPKYIKKRKVVRDIDGNADLVGYVEWHTVADILDETTPDWTHSVKNIRQIGKIVAVTVAITIDGVTREGIGTGVANSEMGIKKAEHDALKRASVKFGIARDLYKKESGKIEFDNRVSLQQVGFPENPIASSLSDLVTAKQLGMIRAIGRKTGINFEKECAKQMHCSTGELSKKAASGLITHLQETRRKIRSDARIAMRDIG